MELENLQTVTAAPVADPARAHWIFWELGLLATLAAVISIPAETNLQAVLGVLLLLFLLGLSNTNNEKPDLHTT